MVTNIFKRLTIRAIIIGFFLTYSANFFVLFCRAAGNLYKQIFIESFIFSLNILLIIILAAISESRRFNLKFGANHLISFPLCILLFAQGHFVNPQKLIIAFSLLFAANILSKEINKINPVKDFFLLGFIFTSLSYINPNLFHAMLIARGKLETLPITAWMRRRDVATRDLVWLQIVKYNSYRN